MYTYMHLYEFYTDSFKWSRTLFEYYKKNRHCTPYRVRGKLDSAVYLDLKHILRTIYNSEFMQVRTYHKLNQKRKQYFIINLSFHE